jgi:8-oxo-dGTP diphosphatase
MRSSTVLAVADTVQHLVTFDVVEEQHRDQTLGWLTSTDDIFRRAKPATPAPHLVSYGVLLDPAGERLLLVDHRLAGLWLPTGGHVEPEEDPAQAVRREIREELGIEADPLGSPFSPFFLTWAETVGADPHIDVSLWFLLRGQQYQPLRWDDREFASVRWWSPAEIRQTPAARFDPHLSRFLAKLEDRDIWAE